MLYFIKECRKNSLITCVVFSYMTWFWLLIVLSIARFPGDLNLSCLQICNEIFNLSHFEAMSQKCAVSYQYFQHLLSLC